MTGGRRTLASVIAFAGLVASPEGLRAQGEPLPVQFGPVAGIAWSPQSVSFDNGPSLDQRGLSVHFGLRLAPLAIWSGCHTNALCRELGRVLVTGHLAYGATHLRGMDPVSDEFAFSFVDPLGIKLAYPVLDRLRLTAIMRSGRRTAERVVDGEVVNYWGQGGTARGFGIEIPIAKSGRGLEVTLLRLAGRFDSVETLNADRTEKLVLPADLAYNAIVLQVGWSGPFTGISLPWR